jgi:glycosyltransferase involved in cell wall biosynthesis
MEIVFVGESWRGSSARSLREAITTTHEDVAIVEVDTDHFLPMYRGLPLRMANRLLEPLHRAEFEHAIRRAVLESRPDAVLIYKGSGIGSKLIAELQAWGYPVVNVFPDYSPHAYGRRLQKAVGRSNLVISTKPFHPALWRTVYGYHNPCVCVPHGYDPDVHLWSAPVSVHEHDVAICATWRPEYHRLMASFAEALGGAQITVAIAGLGWLEHRHELPRHWHFSGARSGRAYGEFLRSAKIAIAPVNRDVVVRGVKQPGDEDTTRTYELAAGYCCFMHQRTDYVATIYDEKTEVPLWRDPTELAQLVLRWLPDEACSERHGPHQATRWHAPRELEPRCMRVVHFLRRTGAGCYSLERYFADVREALPADIAVEVSVNRYDSQGLLRRCYDMLRAPANQGDVNHVTGTVHFLTFLLKRRRTILTILDCGSLDRMKGWRRRVFWVFWFWAPSKRCAVITVISQFTKQEVLKHLRCDPVKIEVVYCTVSPEFTASPYVFNQDCPTILQVGTNYNKNIDRVAVALDGVRCRLVVVGPLSARQASMLREHGIDFENHVDVPRDELPILYQHADLVMFASVYEGFGLPIVEANAVGRPVITSRVASMPEVGADAACYVDPYDTASIRAGVERICRDEVYRQQLISNGFRNVERFRTPAIAQQFAKLYRRVYADARAH